MDFAETINRGGHALNVRDCMVYVDISPSKHRSDAVGLRVTKVNWEFRL